MLDSQWSKAFANDWIDSWNSHDIERILSHYADDFEMSSPLIVQRLNDPAGTLKGKEALRSYWQPSLAADPPLRFELIDILVGINSITLYYMNVGRRLVAETLFFDEQRRAVKGMSQWSVDASKSSARHGSTASQMSKELNDPGESIGFALPDWEPPGPLSREPMQGRTCRLEVLDPERHADDLHDANMLDTENRIWKYLPYGPFDTTGAYRKWAEEVSKGSDPLFHAIVDSKTGKAVGVASYLRISPASGSIEVGHINYSPLLQRKPAATEAMYLMMKRVFEAGYRRYEWKCDALNARSRSAAQRLGFSFEGIFRQATVYKGRNRDTAWYAMIDKEWPELDEAFRRWLDAANFEADGSQRLRLSELTKPILHARG